MLTFNSVDCVLGFEPHFLIGKQQGDVEVIFSQVRVEISLLLVAAEQIIYQKMVTKPK